jgi:hypothetical protein
MIDSPEYKFSTCVCRSMYPPDIEVTILSRSLVPTPTSSLYNHFHFIRRANQMERHQAEFAGEDEDVKMRGGSGQDPRPSKRQRPKDKG